MNQVLSSIGSSAARLGGAVPWIALAMLIAVYSAPAVGQGDDMERAREAYSRGQDLFAAGDFVAARAAFQDSMDAFPHYRTIFNIALCEEKLSRFTEAIELYQRYVDWPGEVPNRVEVAAKIEQLRELLPPEPEPEPEPAPEPEPEPEPAPEAGLDLVVPGWISVGVGAAGVITGGVLLGLAQSKARDIENVEGERYDPAVHDKMIEDGRTYERAGWIVGAVGAAAIAVGVTMLLISDPAEEQPADDELAAGFVPSKSGGAAVVRWSF